MSYFNRITNFKKNIYIHSLTYSDQEDFQFGEIFLNDAELTIMKKKATKYDRDNFLLSRLLLRACLSHYLQIPVKNLSFTKSEYGRPILKGYEKCIDFNITHTKGAILVGISPYRIGVDIENIRLKTFPHEIINKYFSAKECIFLKNKDLQLQSKFSYGYWTRKESLIKADGRGLLLNLAQLDTSHHNDLNVPSEFLLDTNLWFIHTYELKNDWIWSITTNIKKQNIEIIDHQFKHIISFLKNQ